MSTDWQVFMWKRRIVQMNRTGFGNKLFNYLKLYSANREKRSNTFRMLPIVLTLGWLTSIYACTRHVCSSFSRNYGSGPDREKAAQRIACQLLEGRAREVPICCKHLSTKGGSGTEGCGGIHRSRIAWLFRLCTESFKSVKERTYIWLVTLYFVTPILRILAILLRSIKKNNSP